MRFAGAVRGELEGLLNMCSWFVDYMRERGSGCLRHGGCVGRGCRGVGVKWTK